MPRSRMCPSRVHKRSGRSKIMKNLVKKKRKHIHVDVDLPFSSVSNTGISVNEQFQLPNQLSPEKDHKKIDIDLDLPPLEIEPDEEYKPLVDLMRRRIVDLAHLLIEYEKVIKHPTKCTMGRMKLTREFRSGLLTRLYFYCDNCEKGMTISSEPEPKNINNAVAWGSLSTGIGYSQCDELFGVLNIPFMASKTYSKEVAKVKRIWQMLLFDEMEKAGVEERRIAIAKGNLTPDGIPYVTVIVDGGWSKRSYGHGYNAASGVGIIIGAETKKPLYLGVRNKICATCSYYKKNGKTAKEHDCCLNFKGPSTSMEQNIIVEGFCKSMELHNLIYKFFIGDGDSSVYARIVERVPYGRHVIKIECANHITRGICDKLHKLSMNTTYSINCRKLLSIKAQGISRLDRIVRGVRMSIKRNTGDADTLRQEIKNAKG